MSKFTAAELEETAVAYAGYCKAGYINNVTPTFEYWWAKRNKPANKIIDMAHFIKSGIDMEFWDDSVKEAYIGTLDSISHSNARYKSSNGYGDFGTYENCRPRMNHKMFHDGGDCPLPEGFKLKLYCRGSAEVITHVYAGRGWIHGTTSFADIIGYEILGLADGWAYPWEKDE